MFMLLSIISTPKLALVHVVAHPLILFWNIDRLSPTFKYMSVQLKNTRNPQSKPDHWRTLSRITGCSKMNPITLLCRYGSLNYAQRREKDTEIQKHPPLLIPDELNQVLHCWLQLRNSSVFSPSILSHRVLCQIMLFFLLQGINHRGRSWTPFSFFLKWVFLTRELFLSNCMRCCHCVLATTFTTWGKTRHQSKWQ